MYKCIKKNSLKILEQKKTHTILLIFSPLIKVHVTLKRTPVDGQTPVMAPTDGDARRQTSPQYLEWTIPQEAPWVNTYFFSYFIFHYFADLWSSINDNPIIVFFFVGHRTCHAYRW